MDLHLNNEQADLLVAELDRIIDGDCYPLSPRIQALRGIRALLKRPARRPRRRRGSMNRPPRADIRRRR